MLISIEEWVLGTEARTKVLGMSLVLAGHEPLLEEVFMCTVGKGTNGELSYTAEVNIRCQTLRTSRRTIRWFGSQHLPTSGEHPIRDVSCLHEIHDMFHL